MQNQTGASLTNDISSPAVNPQVNPLLGYKDVFYQLEQLIGADVTRVRELVQNGTITQDQGQYLLIELAQKAQQINMYKNSQMASQAPVEQSEPMPQPQVQKDPMTLFNEQRPGFFEQAGRTDVLNYIKGFDMDKDEILRISKLVEHLENSAVDKYLKKTAYEKSLNDDNALAKSKLTAYAQNAPSADNFTRVYTREEIGKMSGDEFTRNEKAIMDQLKQGLIR